MPPSPMLQPCVVSGCASLTLAGGTCVAHDPPPRTFPRGRPYVADGLLTASRLVMPSLELGALVPERQPLLH